jgi:hypothetical protein
MSAFDIFYVTVVTIGMAAFFLAIGVWIFTRPPPWKHRSDRRERLPNPNCRARVVQPHKYSRWWV